MRKLTHEQAVEFGRRGGCAPRRRRRQGNSAGSLYGARMTVFAVRIPVGLKEWYQARAKEQGMTVSDLIREILQAKREAVTGDEVKDA